MDKKMKHTLKNMFALLVVIIGAYMLFTFSGGGLTPPVLSGVAFIIIGVHALAR